MYTYLLKFKFGFLLFVVSFFVMQLNISAQNKKPVSASKLKANDAQFEEDKEVADRYFQNEEYYEASSYYLKAVNLKPSDPYVTFKLAESYRLYFNYNEAEKWYQQSITLASKEYPLNQFWLGLMQKTNGKYEEAKLTFDTFVQNFVPETKQDKDYSDLALLEYNGCVMAVDQMKKPLREYKFGVIPMPVNSKNSDYAPMIFMHDSSIVLTSAREGSKGDDVYGTLGEAFSDNYRFEKKQKWEALGDKDNFNDLNTTKNDGAGVLTKNKKKYYYTRCDEPDGECAIYVSKLLDNKWQKPIKLNQNVNMPKYWNAQPTLTESGDTMYFVSKRPGGLGMHDIWMSIKAPGTEESWTQAVNLGDRINTPFIDMSPCYFSAQQVLFFASNGHEGFGGLDIFMAKGSILDTIRNVGLPFNSNRDDFYFVLGDSVGYLSSNREGSLGNDDIYKFDIKSRQSIIAVVMKDSLGGFKSISIVGRILFDDGSPAQDIQVFLTDENGVTLKVARTNSDGKFRFDNLPADRNYRVVLQEDDARLTAEIDYVVDDLKIRGSDKLSTKKLFENVYFDYDKAELRPEAMKVLDGIVSFHLEHKENQIELKANTDSWGKNGYNKSLSENRAKACYDYLVSKGVDKTSLVINPQGEDKPIATNKNHAGRQLNRRVEFFILGEGAYEAEGMVYIVEPKMTLYSIARNFQMTVDELKSMNNIEGQELKAFQPLRVRRTGDADIIAPVSMTYVEKTGNDGSKPENRKGNKTSVVTIKEEISIPEEPKKEETTTPVEQTVEMTIPKADTSSAPIATPKQESGTNIEEGIHIVKPLETLYSICRQYGITVDQIKTWNHLGNTPIKAGQKLKIKS